MIGEEAEGYYVTRPWASDVVNNEEETDFINSSIFGLSDFFDGTWEVSTLYKKKPDKVKPVNLPHPGGMKPEGTKNWRM